MLGQGAKVFIGSDSPYRTALPSSTAERSAVDSALTRHVARDEKWTAVTERFPVQIRGKGLLACNPVVERAVACADTVGEIHLHIKLSPHLIIQASHTHTLAEAPARVDSGERRVVNLLNHCATAEG